MLASKLLLMTETCFINKYGKVFVSDAELKSLEDKSFEEISEHIESKYSKQYERNSRERSDRKSHKKVAKNDNLSEKQRKLGNEEFVRKAYNKSLKFYYDALTLAESRSSRAFCYGNISAVLFKQQNFDSCLIAVQRVKENYQVEDNFYSKILEREKRCHSELKNHKSTKNSNRLHLKYPANPKNHEVVNCIVTRTNGGVFAKHSMKAGDIIAITDPFIIGPYGKIGASREPLLVCENCYKSNVDFPGIPCETCVKVVYCNENCQAEDREFHKFVCQDAYDVSRRPHFEMMVLKFTLKLLMEGVDIRQQTSSTTSCFDWEEDTFENRVKSTCALKTVKMDNLVTMDTFILILTVLKELKMSNDFRTLLDNFENGDDLFFKTYLRGFQLVYFNYFSSLFPAVELVDSTHFDLVRGFFKHSCSPNVVVYSHSETGLLNYYTLLDNVKPGDELTLSFGGTFHYSLPTPQRQILLKKFFRLVCKCKACRGLVAPDDAGFTDIKKFLFEINAILRTKKFLNNKEFDDLVARLSTVTALSAKVLILLKIYEAFFKFEE